MVRKKTIVGVSVQSHACVPIRVSCPIALAPQALHPNPSKLQVLGGLHKSGKTEGKWRNFMEFQIRRTRDIFRESESGVDWLDQSARLPVWWVSPLWFS